MSLWKPAQIRANLLIARKVKADQAQGVLLDEGIPGPGELGQQRFLGRTFHLVQRALDGFEITAFLDVEPGELARRLDGGRRKRPLLASEDWRERLNELCRTRRAAYLKADVRLSLDDLDMDACVELAEREFVAAERIIEERETTGDSATPHPSDCG